MFIKINKWIAFVEEYLLEDLNFSYDQLEKDPDQDHYIITLDNFDYFNYIFNEENIEIELPKKHRVSSYYPKTNKTKFIHAEDKKFIYDFNQWLHLGEYSHNIGKEPFICDLIIQGCVKIPGYFFLDSGEKEPTKTSIDLKNKTYSYMGYLNIIPYAQTESEKELVLDLLNYENYLQTIYSTIDKFKLNWKPIKH